MSVTIKESEIPPRLVRLDLTSDFLLNRELAENFVVREVVAQKLQQAQLLLPSNIKLMIGEVYRTHAKQKRMWHEVFDRIKREYPTANEEEWTRRTEVWIANPYTHGSGHQTGAAVDVTLVQHDPVSGRYTELDMGTRMQEFTPKTVTDCPLLSDEQRFNRNRLLSVMSATGLVNYPDEWWHYSYGDRLWATLIDQPTTLFAALDDRDVHALLR